MENNSFVCYKSFLEMVEQAEITSPELAYKLAKAIMEYGIRGTYDESDQTLNILMVQVIDGIDRAQERYQKTKEVGSTGGRPREFSNEPVAELMRQGLTAAQIAEQLNCSLRTAQRRIKEVRDSQQC